MINLPYILFDSDAELIYSTVPDQNDIRDLFLKSMRRGDRQYFLNFCASPYDPDNPKYCMFQLVGFPPAEYVFAEKNTLSSREINIAYLTSEPSDFHQLMSPASLYYRDITGRCIYDIFRSVSERGMNLTPNGYLIIDSIPQLRDELMRDPISIEFCSIHVIAERILNSFEKIPSFSAIELACQKETDDAEFILEIPLCSYVFLMTALIWIFHTLSFDHRIRLELRVCEDRIAAGFSVNISDTRSAAIDSSSLMSLGELSPSADNLAKIASSIAFNSKITTNVVCKGNLLFTDIIVFRNKYEAPQFHYRDPYEKVPSLVDEFLQFFDMLVSSSESSFSESTGDKA